MIYRAPFYAVSKAVYGSLTTMTGGLQWFDSAVPIPEVEANFKNVAEFAYGVIGSSSADCRAEKYGALWKCSLNLDIYSNYKGRKVLSQQLEQLLNYMSGSDGWQQLQTLFAAEDYALVSISVGVLAINPPLYSETGVWQSGSTTLSIEIQQLD